MKQSKILLFFFAASVFSLSSCLKKDQMNIDPETGLKNVVEFDNTGGNVSKATSKYPGFYSDLGSLKLGESNKFNINVSYSGAEVAPEDITVNLALDPTALETYNTQNGTNYVAPPAEIFNLPTTAVIKKGERRATVQATVTVNNSFDFSKAYALPLKINSASTGQISGNFGKAVYSFGVRNVYDGVYTLHGQFYHPNPANQGKFTVEVEMRTTGANSNKMYSPDLEGYYHPWTSNGSLTAFGAQEPEYTIDPATNKVTVQNAYAGAVTFYTMAPGYDSHYDPATKTIYAKFGYNYAAGPTFNPATNREWTDTLVYKGPR